MRDIAQRGKKSAMACCELPLARMIRPCTAQTEGSFGFRWMAVSASVRAAMPHGQVHFGQTDPQGGIIRRQAAGLFQLGCGVWQGTGAATGFRHSRVARFGVGGTGSHGFGQQHFGIGLLAAFQGGNALLGKLARIGQRIGDRAPHARQMAAGAGQGQQGDCGKQRPYGRSRWHPASRRRKNAREHSWSWAGVLGVATYHNWRLATTPI